MAHFAFASMPAHGHVNPTLPLVAELVDRGHRVTYATGEAMTETVRSVGAEPLVAPFQLPDGPPPGGRLSMEQLAPRMRSMVDSVRATFPVLLGGLEADPPDVVCGDMMATAAPLLADKFGVPYVVSNPSFASNEHFSLRAQMTANMPAESHAMFAGFIEEVREFAAHHGIEANLGPFMGGTAASTLVFIPREFQPRGETFDESFVFLGPSVDGRANAGWQPARQDAPVLLVSLGTVFNARPDFFRLCVEAFGDSHWQVVLAVGDNVDVDDLGPLPAGIEAHRHVPQLEVLEHATAFVSHTGMNSTMEALYFGVPLVAVPQMPEQQANADRVAELGLGKRLDADALTADELRRTVDATAADDTIRANLTAMSARLQSANGPARGADALEALLTPA